MKPKMPMTVTPNKQTLYTVRKIRNNSKLYGPSHGSEDGEKTICGKSFILRDRVRESEWYITNNTFDGVITCEKCLKKIDKFLSGLKK